MGELRGQRSCRGMSLECKKARGAGVDAGRGVMRTESEKRWNVSQELPQK